MDFGGIITAMVTPFNDDLTVDFEAAANLASYLVDNGSEGLVITGTTGESTTLTMDESAELYKVVMASVGDRAYVIAGSGSNSTAEAIHLTQAAEAAGVHASLQVAPYYNKPSQEGFYRHFKSVAANTALPLILYNIPGRTAKNVEPETIIRLSEIDNIVGVKEASGSLDAVTKIVIGSSEGFLVYSGDDSMTLPIVSLGGRGVISVASHIAGNEMSEMIEAFSGGDHKRATSLHNKLSGLFRVLFIAPNPAPVKAALNILGRNVGGVRLPLVEATDDEKVKITAVLKDLGIA
ncbi:MAG: 4-hydroxy-tetrahydrodipicolinate synthase [Actinomycetota bacterium]